MLSKEQIESYHEKGYLHIPSVFSLDEIKDLRKDLEWMIEVWAEVEKGWSGPWRKQLMDSKTEAKSKLISMHDLHFYAESWMRAVTKPAIGKAISLLLTSDEDGPEGAPVELHHTTMHVKPPRPAIPSRCIKTGHFTSTLTTDTSTDWSISMILVTPMARSGF